MKLCPKCGGNLTIIAAISMLQYELIQKILEHLKLPFDFSEPIPARYPSEMELDFGRDASREQYDDWVQDEDRAWAPRGPP
jgi:hypothetical protein